MLVSAKEMLTKAKAGKYAVGLDKVYPVDGSGTEQPGNLRCFRGSR